MENLAGIWQAKKEVNIDDDKGKEINEHYVFYYKGDSVTIRLINMHPVFWKSEDDFYKLKAKLENNTLYYLPPFGNWTELAVLENNQFVIIGNGKKRIFKRILPEEVFDWNKAILKENRSLHDYRVTPDGNKK
jgi:hypothetical protein